MQDSRLGNARSGRQVAVETGLAERDEAVVRFIVRLVRGEAQGYFEVASFRHRSFNILAGPGLPRPYKGGG